MISGLPIAVFSVTWSKIDTGSPGFYSHQGAETNRTEYKLLVLDHNNGWRDLRPLDAVNASMLERMSGTRAGPSTFQTLSCVGIVNEVWLGASHFLPRCGGLVPPDSIRGE